ncbi:MAG: 30S ribosomal protein S6 [Phycisphaerae bacterium]|jgi:small subunit ribosomal protein S6
MRLYEALFLVDSALAAGDWTGLVEKITVMINKRGGEIVSLKKWDERKLAYEIQNKSRGTYILVYFNAEPDSIMMLERDINLSEDVMRAMILRADFVNKEAGVEKETPLEAADRIEREEAAKREIEEAAGVENSADSKAKAGSED